MFASGGCVLGPSWTVLGRLALYMRIWPSVKRTRCSVSQCAHHQKYEPIAVTLLLIVQPLLLFLHHLLLLPSFQMNAGTKKVLILTSFASACILTLLAFRLPAIAISAASAMHAAPPSPGSRDPPPPWRLSDGPHNGGCSWRGTGPTIAATSTR